jgi:hypothetical protein
MELREIAKNKFEFRSKGRLLEVEISDGQVLTKDGEDNPIARAYHATGGTIAIRRFMEEDLWAGEDLEIQEMVRKLIRKNKLL